MGVLSDLSGKPAQALPPVPDRKFLDIDIDNFDERMTDESNRAHRRRQMQVLLERGAGPAQPNDPAAALQGVRFLPWADWPNRLQGPRAEMAFWQQDAQGRFIGAANRLQKLWGDAP